MSEEGNEGGGKSVSEQVGIASIVEAGTLMGSRLRGRKGGCEGDRTSREWLRSFEGNGGGV